MKNNPSTFVNTALATSNGYLADINPNRNDPNLISKTSEQLPPSGDDMDISHIPAQQSVCERIFSWRSFIIVLLHLSYMINMIPMVIMSMALVCMCGPIGAATNHTVNDTMKAKISTYMQVSSFENVTLPQGTQYEFNWDSQIQGLLISGHLFTLFLVPQLSNIIRSYIGNKLTLTIFTSTLAFLFFVSPIAARTSVNFFLAVRILSGLCMDANMPISADTLAWWIPVREKLTSTTIVVLGWITAGIMAPVLSGYFCSSGIDNGWPMIFYFNGMLMVAWTIAWYTLSARKPEQHPFVSKKEKAYIMAHRANMNNINTKEGKRTPYRIILTSRPVLVFLAAICANFWATTIIFTCLPLYLTSVLKFSIEATGILMTVMSCLRLPAGLVWSVLGNWLLERKTMTTNKVRKICYGLGETLTSVSYFGVSFLNEDQKMLASVLVIVSFMASSFGSTMSSLIPLDMAPRYAGFIVGLATSLSCLIALTAPLTVAAITEQGSFEEWRIMWIIMALVTFTAGLIFIVFGNASQQSWAVSDAISTIRTTHTQPMSNQRELNESAVLNLHSQNLKT